MTRTRRSTLTAITSVGGTVVVMVVGFVTTPYLLRDLGAERFGAFRAASDWLGYLNLLELGVGGALIAVFARSLGSGKTGDVVAAAHAGVRAYLRIAVGMAMVGAILVAVIPSLVGGTQEISQEVRIGSAVSLVALIWLPLATARPLAEAGQRGYVVNLLNSAQLLVGMVLCVVFASAGWGLPGQFAAIAIASAGFHFALAGSELRRRPELLQGLPPGTERPGLWALSWPTLVFNVASRVGLLTDNIVIAFFLGPTAVTPFVLTQRLVQAGLNQVTAFGTSSWAGLLDLWFRGEREVFTRRLVEITRLTAVVGIAVLLPIAVWNRVLIELWIGPEGYAGPLVTWLAVGNAWLLAVSSVWGWPLTAGGHIRSLLPAILTSATVNFTFSLVGTAVVGLPGPLLGTAAGVGLVSWWWVPLLLKHHFSVPPRRLLAAATRPVFVATPYGLCLILIAEAVPAFDPQWPKWACWMTMGGWFAGSACIYLLIAWRLVLSPEERNEWVGRFHRGHRTR